jgi:hydrogenase expression/formation protein HypC
MCLGVPGKITEIHDTGFLRQGSVDFGGVSREVCLSCTPEAQVGDYVIVHVGFAISQIDEEEAHATLEVLRQMGELDEELGLAP